jgi:hypothetical protein
MIGGVMGYPIVRPVPEGTAPRGDELALGTAPEPVVVPPGEVPL